MKTKKTRIVPMMFKNVIWLAPSNISSKLKIIATLYCYSDSHTLYAYPTFVLLNCLNRGQNVYDYVEYIQTETFKCAFKMQIIAILVGTQPTDMVNRNREFLIHFKHPSLKVHFSFRALKKYIFLERAAKKQNNEKKTVQDGVGRKKNWVLSEILLNMYFFVGI